MSCSRNAPQRWRQLEHLIIHNARLGHIIVRGCKYSMNQRKRNLFAGWLPWCSTSEAERPAGGPEGIVNEVIDSTWQLFKSLATTAEAASTYQPTVTLRAGTCIDRQLRKTNTHNRTRENFIPHCCVWGNRKRPVKGRETLGSVWSCSSDLEMTTLSNLVGLTQKSEAEHLSLEC